MSASASRDGSLTWTCLEARSRGWPWRRDFSRTGLYTVLTYISIDRFRGQLRCGSKNLYLRAIRYLSSVSGILDIEFTGRHML
jgi:hypothetical protein